MPPALTQQRPPEAQPAQPSPAPAAPQTPTTAPQLAAYLDNTTPWAKQQEAFEAALQTPLFAATMEQRTGKLIVSLGLIAYRYEQGLIDAALVVAMPSGVPRNWADEIDGAPPRPHRFPARIPHQTLVWQASRANTKTFQTQLEALLTFPGLAILLVNGEALLTDAFQKFAGRFLRARRTFAIADEVSQLMKTPPGRNKGQRSRVMMRIKPYTQYRLILDGTPADESILDLYSPFAWLDPAFLGHDSFYSFKHYYAEWEQKTVELYDPKLQRRIRRSFEAIKTDETGQKQFAHLDELRQRLSRCSFRVTRDQCFDIPNKLYSEYRYDLTPEQRRVYDELEAEHESNLSDGTQISVSLILTRYLRLQQILSNTYPSPVSGQLCGQCEGEGCEQCKGLGVVAMRAEPRTIDRKHHPRLKAMEEIASLETGSLIVWARFTNDIDELLALGHRLNKSPVRYDGTITLDEKTENLRAFQQGHAAWIVANQVAMQRGIDASRASAQIFYSNTFSGLQRRQCEDRTEAFGRNKGTGITDIVANDTIDEKIVAAHLSKRSVADYIMQQHQSER